MHFLGTAPESSEASRHQMIHHSGRYAVAAPWRSQRQLADSNPLHPFFKPLAMYCPATFEESRPDVLQGLLARHPLATLVHVDAQGLVVDHIPLLWRPAPDQAQGCLMGHVARANPLWQVDPEHAVVAVFQGPQTYISPNWYASKANGGRVVPTWNYAVVHAHGRLQAQHDDSWKRALLNELTRTHEQTQASPWAVDDAPADHITTLLKAIVGIEISISSLQGKWKVSQNQPATNQATVVTGLLAAGSAQQQAMATLVQVFGQATGKGIDRP